MQNVYCRFLSFRKSQIIDRGSVEDDVQLVRREFDVDKQSKSVQV